MADNKKFSKMAGTKMADKKNPVGLAVLFLLCIVAMITCECLALCRRKSAMEKAGVAKARHVGPKMYQFVLEKCVKRCGF